MHHKSVDNNSFSFLCFVHKMFQAYKSKSDRNIFIQFWRVFTSLFIVFSRLFILVLILTFCWCKISIKEDVVLALNDAFNLKLYFSMVLFIQYKSGWFLYNSRSLQCFFYLALDVSGQYSVILPNHQCFVSVLFYFCFWRPQWI